MVSLISIANLTADSDLRLVEAAKNRDTAAVRGLVKQHVDVNARQPDGATALHWAAHWDDLEAADLLIHAGANVNAANDLAVTPLALSCENGNTAMVDKLLQAGAYPNAAVETGETALMTASRGGSLGAVEALLTRGADVNAKEPSRGQTALMWAVAQQHPAIVRALIEHGADIHARSHVRHVYVNRGGRSNGEIEQGGFTPLLFAARQGDINSAELLLAAGANVNETAPDGTSALVVAAHSGHGRFARFLLDKGADPNAADAGYAALHAAVLRGDPDLVRALLAHGANPNSRLTRGTAVTRNGKDWILPETWLGATPVWLAAKFLEVDSVRTLVAGGADPLLSLADETTPLMAAAGIGWGQEAVDRRDRTAYVDPTKTSDDGPTLEAVKLLVELGADLQAVNQAGDTALHGAAARGFNAVAQFLVERGSKLDVKNRRGQTPLAATMGRRLGDGGVQFEFEYLKNTATLLRKLGAKE
jgi:ankyrin repeat protein